MPLTRPNQQLRRDLKEQIRISNAAALRKAKARDNSKQRAV